MKLRNQKTPKLETEPKMDILSNKAHALPSTEEFNAIPTDVKDGAYIPAPMDGHDEQDQPTDNLQSRIEVISEQTDTKNTAKIIAKEERVNIKSYMDFNPNAFPTNTDTLDPRNRNVTPEDYAKANDPLALAEAAATRDILNGNEIGSQEIQIGRTALIGKLELDQLKNDQGNGAFIEQRKEF